MLHTIVFIDYILICVYWLCKIDSHLMDIRCHWKIKRQRSVPLYFLACVSLILSFGVFLLVLCCFKWYNYEVYARTNVGVFIWLLVLYRLVIIISPFSPFHAENTVLLISYRSRQSTILPQFSYKCTDTAT